MPRKLGRDPIVQVVAQLQFGEADQSRTPLLAGMLYSEFGQRFPTLEQLPAAQFPTEIMRQVETNLVFLPTQAFIGDEGAVILGPRSFSFLPSIPYPGWDKLFAVLRDLFGFALRSGCYGDCIRVSLKYTNLLTGKTSSHDLSLTRAAVTLGARNLGPEITHIRAEIPEDGMTAIVKVQTHSTATSPGGEESLGTLVDIDIVVPGPFERDLSAILARISTAHDVEKRHFYNLLTPATLDFYEPEY